MCCGTGRETPCSRAAGGARRRRTLAASTNFTQHGGAHSEGSVQGVAAPCRSVPISEARGDSPGHSAGYVDERPTAHATCGSTVLLTTLACGPSTRATMETDKRKRQSLVMLHPKRCAGCAQHDVLPVLIVLPLRLALLPHEVMSRRRVCLFDTIREAWWQNSRDEPPCTTSPPSLPVRSAL